MESIGVSSISKTHQAVLTGEIAKLFQLCRRPENDQQQSVNLSGSSSRSSFDDHAPLFIDATLGEAGHSLVMLEKTPQSRLIGLDADALMLKRARHFLAAQQERCTLIHTRFGHYFQNQPPETLQADLILFDLGISQFHYSGGTGRGFSFRPQDEKEELDMRLDPENNSLRAADLIMQSSETELASILDRYGEVPNARNIARLICRYRSERQLYRAAELARFIHSHTGLKHRYHKIHPATQVFQALRIAVNGELEELETTLPLALRQIRPMGLLAVISFHSLEDRIVKQTFRKWQAQDLVQWVYKKPVCASPAEQKENPASRSAKLRIVRKLPPPHKNNENLV